MSEEKTRIVPRADAKAGSGTITFQCDNGHRISVPAKLAGKRGTCSKCGIAVVIPLAGQPKPAPAPQPAFDVAAVAPPEPVAVAVEVFTEPPAATPAPDAPAADQFANLFEGPSAAFTGADDPRATTPGD
jgi:hypothetical protein